MDLRIRSLSHLDPAAMPLPVGTEVTTRVDRLLEQHTVGQGAVGRIVAQHGETLDVHVVGVGVVRYARAELLPRKVGQVRYAESREAAWTRLRPATVLEATVGSQAWGLAEQTSDTDVRGVFVLPFPFTQGLARRPEDLVSADGSTTIWEIGKAVRQALRADPNTLEMLFVTSVRPLDAMGEWILAARDAFVSVEIYGSFGRYALSQCKRLRQSQRLAEHRGVILDWLREDPVPTLDEVAERLRRESRLVAPTEDDARHQAKEHVKQLYRSFYDQGLLRAQSYQALVDLARHRAADLELPRELRPKNAYNLLRLIVTAIDWLRSGKPDFVARGAFRDSLLAIKQGRVPLHEVLEKAESLAQELEEARRVTKLPAHPDVGTADRLLKRIGGEAARRWLTADHGPFGRDAPVPPDVRWEES